jgi:large subunit ribosomal protein L5
MPTVPRLQEKYKKEVISKLQEQFKYKNVHEMPRLDKIVVSMGVGKAIENTKRIDAAVKDLAAICGQQPVVTKSKQAVSGFKLRAGMNIGCVVTLRRNRMYEFLDRLVSIAIPRIRDFRGLSRNGFDGHGNFNFGLGDQFVFPEIDVDKTEFPQGMNITIVIKNSSDEESYALLSDMGMPFRRN